MNNGIATTEVKIIDPLELAERNLKQMQHESKLNRMKTSEAIASLMKYVEEHQVSDHLVTGFDENSMKKNPYKRERLNKCTMI